MNTFGWEDNEFSLNHVRLESPIGHLCRKFSNAIGIPGFKILVLEQCRMMRHQHEKQWVDQVDWGVKVVGNKNRKIFVGWVVQGQRASQERRQIRENFVLVSQLLGFASNLSRSVDDDYSQNEVIIYVVLGTVLFCPLRRLSSRLDTSVLSSATFLEMMSSHFSYSYSPSNLSMLPEIVISELRIEVSRSAKIGVWLLFPVIGFLRSGHYLSINAWCGFFWGGLFMKK